MVSIENCKIAILKASKRKEKRKEVAYILKYIDEFAEDLSKRLIALNFTSPYKKKIIQDGLSGKQRELQIPNFYPDQCAHHAIVQTLRPIIEKGSYYWSCANIPKRGIDKACKGIERATIRDQKHAKYSLKWDIAQFYKSISHFKLKKRFRDKIKDKRALAIIFTLIDSHFPGLPIGNYTSPWFAEFFLQPLDRLVKQTCRIPHMVRYADDMTLIDNNKKRLRRALVIIRDWLKEQKLSMKRDYKIFKIRLEGIKRGRKIDFCGRCFARGYTTIRKRRALAFMRQSRYIRKLMAKGKEIKPHFAIGYISRSSCLKHTCSKGLKEKYYDSVNIRKVKGIIRNESKRQLEARCA